MENKPEENAEGESVAPEELEKIAGGFLKKGGEEDASVAAVKGTAGQDAMGRRMVPRLDA